jgi:hypothetical protein
MIRIKEKSYIFYPYNPWFKGKPMTRRTAFLLALLPLLLTGCSQVPPMGTVSGVVTLDGQPLPDVEVQFLPDPEQGTAGANASCYTDEQGRFTLRTERHHTDGALVGTHRVVFVDIAALPNPGELPGMGATRGREDAVGLAAVPRREQKPKKNRVPPMYTDPNQTPYRTIEVKEGDQTLNFDLQTGRRKG